MTGDGEVKQGRRRAGDTRAKMISITVKLDEESAAMLDALRDDLGAGHLAGKTSVVIRKLIAAGYSELMRRGKTIG